MARYARVLRVLPVLLVAAASHVPSGCACESYMAPNLTVLVRDRSGQPAARGATGQALHAGGRETDLFSYDSLAMSGNWDRERAGQYNIHVRKPGFALATARTEVDKDICHVKTRRVSVVLDAQPGAVAVPAIRFLKGDQVVGAPVNTAVRVLGDTLEIAGNSGVRCGGLRAVAIRTDTSWHVQIDPQSWTDAYKFSNPRGQTFEVR